MLLASTALGVLIATLLIGFSKNSNNREIGNFGVANRKRKSTANPNNLSFKYK